MDQELVTIQTNEKRQMYLAGIDGMPIKLAGKEYEFLKQENAREATEEEMEYIQKNITRLFLKATMLSSALNPEK